MHLLASPKSKAQVYHAGLSWQAAAQGPFAVGIPLFSV